MKVLYNDPNDKRYYKWMDNNGAHDIWYLEIESIYDYKKNGLDEKLVNFLNKWDNKIKKIRDEYIELYPVKRARIECIYNDIVYAIYPSTISATKLSNWLSNEYYEIPWDSLFESYQRDIRDDMEKELGIVYTKYIGFLD